MKKWEIAYNVTFTNYETIEAETFEQAQQIAKNLMDDENSDVLTIDSEPESTFEITEL